MSKLQMKEGELEIPTGWEDKTIHVLSCPAGAGDPDASFTVTRSHPDEEGVDLKTYIDGQLVLMAKVFPRFRVMHRDAVDLDGEAAEHIVCTWRSEKGGTVRQEQTVVMLPDGMVLIMTATAQLEKYHQFSDAFCDLVTSFRFGSPQGG